jgi:hypothetical protein
MGIPHDHAKLMTAKQIISLVAFHHHPIPHAVGGPDEPWNLDPVFRKPHDWITAKETVPGIAKERRVQDREMDHRRNMILKTKPRKPEPRSAFPSRGFQRRAK